MLGSDGTRSSYLGASPRRVGTRLAAMVCGSVQLKPPMAVLIRTLLTLVAFAETVSMIQSSTPADVIFPIARCLPSGDHCGARILAPAGSATGISLPSLRLLSV